jgi:hypothetical protein
MGKRSSTAAGTAARKAKMANADGSAVDHWVQTKVENKELSQAKKMGLLKNAPAESLAASPKIVPRPPLGFRVIFIAFLLWGLSFPPHPFLRGLLFATGFSSMT